jgi:hypothetical protein
MRHAFVLESLLPDTIEQVVEIDMPHPFIAGFHGGYFPSPYKCVETTEILSLSCNLSKKMYKRLLALTFDSTIMRTNVLSFNMNS